MAISKLLKRADLVQRGASRKLKRVSETRTTSTLNAIDVIPTFLEIGSVATWQARSPLSLEVTDGDTQSLSLPPRKDVQRRCRRSVSYSDCRMLFLDDVEKTYEEGVSSGCGFSGFLRNRLPAEDACHMDCWRTQMGSFVAV